MTTVRRKPVLTRKHFELIARKISESPGGNLRRRTAAILTPVFKELNPSFNEELFAAQCQGSFSRRVTRRVRPQPQTVEEVMNIPQTLNAEPDSPPTSVDALIFRVGIEDGAWRFLFAEGHRPLTNTELARVVLDGPSGMRGIISGQYVERWKVSLSTTGNLWVYDYDGSAVLSTVRIHTDGEDNNYVCTPHHSWEWAVRPGVGYPDPGQGLLESLPVRYTEGRWVFEGYQRDRVLTVRESANIERSGTDYFRGRVHPRNLQRFAVDDASSSGNRRYTYDHSLVTSDVPIQIDASGVPYTVIPPALWTRNYGRSVREVMYEEVR